MIVKTKKYALPTGKYIRLAMRNVIRQLWWVFLIPIALAAMTFVVPSIWWWITALILTALYLLFWYIQFAGVTRMEQTKMLFDKLSYQIDSRQIIIAISPKQGMPVQWPQVKKAYLRKDGIVLTLNRVQFIYWPYKIFNSTNESKFVESLMRRKGLLPGGGNEA